MNVLLLIVDSLRARSLTAFGGSGTATPFMNRLSDHALQYQRAYSSECWTLPSHVSMFTGLPPSQHKAHFQTMAYRGSAPTAAELLRDAGFTTELVTRNPIFDGRVPGILRGFDRNTRLVAERDRLDPMGLLLAASKPRFRRQVRDSGFFHPDQRASAGFLRDFAQTTLPADDRSLQYVADRVAALQDANKPFFVCCNLFDVHAPYCPSPTSLFAELTSTRDLLDNALSLYSLAKVGSHAYLKSGFRMPDRARISLLERYHRSIELMDEKLSAFFGGISSRGLLEDTLVVLTSDHGEAFGENDLYLHDASVYETNTRVPLWILHPRLPARRISDVVGTRSLFDLIVSAGLRGSFDRTICDESWRKSSAPLLLEHYCYPHVKRMQSRYGRNLAAAVRGNRKVIARGSGLECFEITEAGDEIIDLGASAREFLFEAGESVAQRESVLAAVRHVSGFGARE